MTINGCLKRILTAIDPECSMPTDANVSMCSFLHRLGDVLKPIPSTKDISEECEFAEVSEFTIEDNEISLLKFGANHQLKLWLNATSKMGQTGDFILADVLLPSEIKSKLMTTMIFTRGLASMSVSGSQVDKFVDLYMTSNGDRLVVGISDNNLSLSLGDTVDVTATFNFIL